MNFTVCKWWWLWWYIKQVRRRSCLPPSTRSIEWSRASWGISSASSRPPPPSRPLTWRRLEPWEIPTGCYSYPCLPSECCSTTCPRTIPGTKTTMEKREEGKQTWMEQEEEAIWNNILFDNGGHRYYCTIHTSTIHKFARYCSITIHGV